MKKLNQQGKIPPQALDMEEAVLGAILLEPDKLNNVIDILKPESFYRQANQLIFSAILAMVTDHQPADLLTVTQKLKKENSLDEVGGAFYITSLTSRVSSAANIEVHAAIVQQKYIQREMIRMSSEISRKAYEDSTDPFDLIAEAQEFYTKLTNFDRGSVNHITTGLKELMSVIERNMTGEDFLTGIPTGLAKFDHHSSGLQNSDLVIIAGETSQGKTSLALNIASNAAMLGQKVVIYSYEMSDRQLASRFVSEKTGVSSKSIQYYQLSNEEFEKVSHGIGLLEKAPIYIDELKSSRYDYLERSIRSMVVRENVRLVVIDYLQLIKPTDSRKDKVNAIADIANDLKNLAKQLDIPIVLLSQLSRDRSNPKPTLARLKGSGDIENAADIVWFVWRPEYYNFQEFDCNGEMYSANGLAHHIVAKGRNIGIAEFVSGFDKNTTRFFDYVEHHEVVNEMY